jgi:hypothetical protein
MAVPQPHCATYCAVCAARLHYRRCTKFKAMEFAITVLSTLAGTDDSWLPGGARSFLFRLGGGLELRCG